MKLVHIVPHIDREASGPGYSVPTLCGALAARGHEVVLATLAREEVDRPAAAFRHDSFAPSFGPPRLGVSKDMRVGLLHSAQDADLVHSHSLWMMPNVYPAWAARRAGKPLVISPRGTLSPVALARSRWLKRPFWTLLQGAAVRQADLLHATSEQEHLDIRARGMNQPVAVIPNGIDVPAGTTGARRDRGLRRLLYLGRLHPIKGLEVLIEAWRAVADRFADWELRLVGPGDAAYVARLQRLVAKLDAPRITFAGERYGQAKHEEYGDADLYVLPSFSENFGMSVAEALAHGLPVITTTGAPWAGVLTEGCGWRVDARTDALSDTLTDALGRPPEDLAQMGAAGRTWMARDFSWDRVARDTEAVYQWIIHGGATPDAVRS